MGLEHETPTIDTEALTSRIGRIKDKMSDNTTELLESQNVRLMRGAGRFTGPHTIEVVGESGTEEVEFDSALVSTGSRPRVPDWCHPDGERILTTRDCYPPTRLPGERDRGRVRCHRRRVRPHVLVVRLRRSRSSSAGSRCFPARTPRSQRCSNRSSWTAVSSC